MKKLLSLVIAASVLAGCATPFADSYTDHTRGVDVVSLSNAVPTVGEPQLLRGTTPDEDAMRMFEEGYQVIGESRFSAGNVDESGALRQAKKVGAALVLLYSGHGEPFAGLLPFTPPSPQRMDYMATYWIKLKPPILGARYRALTPETRARTGSGEGVEVFAVARRSPAYEADIQRGDVVRLVGNDRIDSVDDMTRAIMRYAGQQSDLVILRNGKELRKTIKLNNRS